MKVYLVMRHDYEDDEVLGVFLDEERANSFSDYWNKTEASEYGPSSNVEEFGTRDEEDFPDASTMIECYRVDMVGEFIFSGRPKKEWRTEDSPAIVEQEVYQSSGNHFKNMFIDNWSRPKVNGKPVDLEGQRQFTMYVPTSVAKTNKDAHQIAMKMREDYLETEDREEGI